jgi:hypothetical protein
MAILIQEIRANQRSIEALIKLQQKSKPSE